MSDKARSAEGAVIARNRKAGHDYTILEKYECGIVLAGTEVKSCREHGASVGEAYAKVENGQMMVYSMNIAPYGFGNRFNHDSMRPRKLLLHKKEILKLGMRVKEKGLALIPLSLYFKKGRVKMELGLGKGKTFEDKRDTIKKRQDDIDVRREAGRY